MAVFIVLQLERCVCGGDEAVNVLLLKGTKQQISVYDTMPMMCRFFHASLAFQFRTCWIIEGPFEEKNLNRMHNLDHTNKYM
jgi:hypothetical protein